MKTTISTTIDAFIHKEAKDHDIAWSDALEFGIKFLIAQKEGFDYPENKLLSKIQYLSKIIQDQSQEIENLKQSAPVVDAKKEAEEILKDLGVAKDE